MEKQRCWRNVMLRCMLIRCVVKSLKIDWIFCLKIWGMKCKIFRYYKLLNSKCSNLNLNVNFKFRMKIVFLEDVYIDIEDFLTKVDNAFSCVLCEQ